MDTLTLDLPAMYGDHHVLDVRRMLLDLPGVKEVYASSAFQVVEVTFDPDEVAAADIEAVLDEAGYLEPLTVPLESHVAAYQGNGDTVTYFRHSTAYAQTGNVAGFAQQVSYTGRPLWPCPGMGRIPAMDAEEKE